MKSDERICRGDGHGIFSLLHNMYGMVVSPRETHRTKIIRERPVEAPECHVSIRVPFR